MKNLSDFPDLSGIFDQFKLRDWLEEISDQTILGFAIRLALKNGTPLGEIVKMILDQYYDNPEAVVDIVSYRTMCLIKQMTKGINKDNIKTITLDKNKSHA